MALVNLLGDKVIGKDGDVDVSSLEGEGKVVGIYFSAHWCPPCRSFTPHLAKWYKKLREKVTGDKFEIVFVSSDRDEQAFTEYFEEMPWLALSYDKREKKAELSKKYKVSGIPTLVMVNAENGTLISTDGRSIVMEDESGKEFPWTPKPFSEIISSGKLKGPDGKAVDTEEVIKGKVLGVYFSAHWCGPCKAFTPSLIKIYNKLKEDGKNFEIVFVSSDKSEDEYKKYFDTMPWYAVPFGDSRKKALSRLYEVEGIPTLVILDENGEVITGNGRGALTDDEDGAEFPWHPKPVRKLTSSSASDINEYPALIWFNKGEGTDNPLKTVEPIAEEFIAKAKAKGEDSMEFYVLDMESDDDDIGESLRGFAGLGQENPLLVIVDVPSQKVYISKAGTITGEEIRGFVESFYAGTAEGRPLRQ